MQNNGGGANGIDSSVIRSLLQCIAEKIFLQVFYIE